MKITFCWWNLQDFSHFDPKRAGEARWPTNIKAYEAKLERVLDAFRDIFSNVQIPDIMALGEVTQVAAMDLRNKYFPDYQVLSMDLRPNRSELQIAILYKRDQYLESQNPIVVPDTPRGTRPMAVLDFCDGKHQIRFIVCHWTARFEKISEDTRSNIAKYLSGEIYNFIHEKEEGIIRHVVILGDLNEEPFGLIENRLYAIRSRKRALDEPHYTDLDIRRHRLYNCSWRMLGEHRPHDGTIASRQIDFAGTYYWREKKSWLTLDHIIVDGTLLTEECPFLDETSVKVFFTSLLFDQDGLPRKFKWFGGTCIGRISDHLPIGGTIILER